MNRYKLDQEFSIKQSTLRTSRFLLFYLLTLLFLVSCLSCGLDVEDPTPPSKPQWIEKSLPEEWPERGIDAHESGGIYIEWQSSPDDDIKTYYIYRAAWDDINEELSEYELVHKIEIISNSTLEYIDRNVETRISYMYKIKAVDMSDNVSEFSESLDYKLLPSIYVEHMVPNGPNMPLGADRELSWLYPVDIEMENYTITIVSNINELVWREEFSPGNYIGATESWQVPNTISLEINHKYRWRIDTGANYTSGVENSGSESPWGTFIVIN